jgi:hypothetical protein
MYNPESFVHTNFDIYVFISQFLAAQTSKVPKYVKDKSIALYDTYYDVM